MTFDTYYKEFLDNLPSYRGFINKEDMKRAWGAGWDAAIDAYIAARLKIIDACEVTMQVNEAVNNLKVD